MITHSISRYIRLKSERENCPIMFSPKDGKKFHNGSWMPYKDFDKIHPRVEYRKFNEKGVNPNRKMDSLL